MIHADIGIKYFNERTNEIIFNVNHNIEEFKDLVKIPLSAFLNSNFYHKLKPKSIFQLADRKF